MNKQAQTTITRDGVRVNRLIPLILLVAASGAVSPVHAAPAKLPVVTAPAAIVVDGWSGRVLYQKNADVERYPASTVKIMTALIVLNRLGMNTVVTVGSDAVSYGGSTAGLYLGERMTVWNLLHGMLMPSGNDAAVALADAVAGTAPAFARLMNEQARKFHLWHTHYLTPNGFDVPGQVTTARDLATLARIAMRRPVFARIVRTRTWNAWDVTHRIEHHWVNLNHLLWRAKWFDGVKTGTTPGAGACLVSSEERGTKWVVAVNLGSVSEAARFSDARTLLAYGWRLDSGLPQS